MPAACWESLKRVAAEIGELDDLVALVVVAEDDELIAELRASGPRCVRRALGPGILK